MTDQPNSAKLKEALEGLKAFVHGMDMSAITDAGVQTKINGLKTPLGEPASISALADADLKTFVEKISPALTQLNGVMDRLPANVTALLKPLTSNVKSAAQEFLNPEKKDQDDELTKTMRKARAQLDEQVTEKFKKVNEKLAAELNPNWFKKHWKSGTLGVLLGVAATLGMKGCSDGPDKREEQRLGRALTNATNDVATLKKVIEGMKAAPSNNYYRDVLLVSIDTANLNNQNFTAPVGYLTGMPREELEKKLSEIGAHSLSPAVHDAIRFTSNDAWMNGRTAVATENVLHTTGGVKAFTNGVSVVETDMRIPAIRDEKKNIAYRFWRNATHLIIERDVGAVKTNIVQIGQVPIVE